MIAALAPLAGIANLAIYTHYIGRPDVFMPSLVLGPGLLVLWLAGVLALVMIIFCMSVTSIILSATLNWLAPATAHVEEIVRKVFSVTAASMLGITLPAGFVGWTGETPSLAWMLIIFVPPAVYSWFFFESNLGRLAPLPLVHTKGERFVVCVQFSVLVGVTAFVGIFPAAFVTILYEKRPVTGGWVEALMFCFVAMLASLAPSIGYFLSSPKGKFAQIKAMLIGFLIIAGVGIITMPSIFSLPSIAAVKFLGISDRQVKRYLIKNEEYPAYILDAKRWSLKFSMEKQFLVSGFALYTHGGVQLLCPSDLAKLPEKELDQHTAACIAFAGSAVKPLDGVER